MPRPVPGAAACYATAAGRSLDGDGILTGSDIIVVAAFARVAPQHQQLAQMLRFRSHLLANLGQEGLARFAFIGLHAYLISACAVSARSISCSTVAVSRAGQSSPPVEMVRSGAQGAAGAGGQNWRSGAM